MNSQYLASDAMEDKLRKAALIHAEGVRALAELTRSMRNS